MNSNEEFKKNLIEKLLSDMKLMKDEREILNILTFEKNNFFFFLILISFHYLLDVLLIFL